MSRHIGRCAYCGSTENLSKEHIIPLGLGGEEVLYKASCGACRDETSKIEGRVLDVAWKGFRVVVGMPTRHKKTWPTALRAEVRNGGGWTQIDLPVAQYTGAAGFPRFGREPAALHSGQDDGLEVKSIYVVKGNAAGVDPTISPAAIAGASEYRVPVGYDVDAIARMLAKIAHCSAIDLFGPDAFEPFLVDCILGRADDLGHWIGAPGGSMFDDPPARGHRIRVGTIEDSRAIMAGIQFLADAGTPEYLVVVGELYPTAPAQADAPELAATT